MYKLQVNIIYKYCYFVKDRYLCYEILNLY